MAACFPDFYLFFADFPAVIFFVQIERVFIFVEREVSNHPKALNVNSVHKYGDFCTVFTLEGLQCKSSA